MGHTGIYAFGDCVRRVDLGQLATVVELRIPCVYTWGVSIFTSTTIIQINSKTTIVSAIGVAPFPEGETAKQRLQQV